MRPEPHRTICTALAHTVASANPRWENYELQHRNNPRRHRDHLRPDHLHHQRAACAGRSHPARAGDYFRRTRKRKFEKQLKNSELFGRPG
jgi:hypothetical protein